jgi:hypothetical protein
MPVSTSVSDSQAFATSASLNYLANKAWLAAAGSNAFYLIGFAVFQCMEYH